MNAAQEDGMWRAIGALEMDVKDLLKRPLQKPFRVGLGLALGATVGFGIAIIAIDHVRDWKRGRFDAVRVEMDVYPRWREPQYDPITEFEL